ncbi:MAG: thiamine phosphate synthase [Bacteroidales bacterium]|nr:thiamine phosphate synthase [Bacteroidales bacterium]
MKGLLFISHQTSRYSTLDSIRLALAGGCKQIQLRMKNSSHKEILSTAQAALDLCKRYDADLFINDDVSICKEIKAQGVHLGKKDLPPSKARKILNKGSIIGGTANSWKDVLYLQNENVDYIGLGPYQYTTTKKNLSAILGLNGYKQILALCHNNKIEIPILAIGGITAEDIPPLLELGISGIALSSTILKADNPIEETKKVISIIQKTKK